MTSTRGVRLACVAIVAGQVAVFEPGLARGQAAEAEKPEPSMTEVEEITVTAQRREERIQDTPVSVTAVTSKTIAEQGIENVIDMAPLAPNLYVRTNVGGNSGQTMSMRGAVSTDQMVTMEQAVGVYVDGVYVAKSAGSRFDLRDIERIEVVRGPQGTLYGRNTIGGAINVITKKPQGDRSVSAFTSAGNYESFRGSLTADLPVLGENGLLGSPPLGTVNARSTIQYRSRDGFFENTGTGSGDFENLNRIETNHAVQWLPWKPLTVDYSFDYTRARERPRAFQLTALRPEAPAFPLMQFLVKPYIEPQRADAIANNAVMAPNGGTHELVSNLDVRGHALTNTLDLGEVGPLGTVTLKSITGYRSFNLLEVFDLDGSPVSVGDFAVSTGYRSLSEEVQWLGVTPRVNYVAGFYYQWDKGSEDSDQVIMGGAPIPVVTSSVSANRVRGFSYAPFGQATWTPPVLEDRLSLTAGLRYSRENKRQELRYTCVKATGRPCEEKSFEVTGGQAERDFDAVTPMGSVAYRWTDDLMTYVKVSRGFKSGGYNGRSTTAETFRDPYKSEKLTAYEAGLKSDWFDRRLRVNVSGFFSDYTDLQVGVLRTDPEAGGAVTTVENAADAEIKGLELEMQAVPVRGVSLRLAYGWLDPEYKEFTEFDEDTNQTVDVSDERHFSVTPEHTLSGGIAYTAEPTQWGTLSAGLDAYWQDGVVFAVKDVDLNAQGSYGLLNARLQLADIPTAYGTFDIAGFARNLTDRKYRVYGVDFGDLGIAVNTYGNPRTLGVEIGWRWGKTQS